MGAFTEPGALMVSATDRRAHTADTDKPIVVDHIATLDKVASSSAQHQESFRAAWAAPDKVTIELVVHGPALKAFHAASANADVTRRFGEFSKAGLAAQACGNSMKTQNVTLKDLLPGFGIADRGGVVRIAELQALGYAYLKP